MLVRIAPLAVQQLLVANGHAAAANPIVAVPGMNMVEICQRGVPEGDTLPEYQIGCERDPEAARLKFPPKGARGTWQKYVMSAGVGLSSATGSATRTT